MKSFEVDSDDVVKLLFLHLEERRIFRDACTIDENRGRNFIRLEHFRFESCHWRTLKGTNLSHKCVIENREKGANRAALSDTSWSPWFRVQPTEMSTRTKPERHHTRSQREQTSLNGSSEVGREKEEEGEPINGEWSVKYSLGREEIVCRAAETLRSTTKILAPLSASLEQIARPIPEPPPKKWRIIFIVNSTKKSAKQLHQSQNGDESTSYQWINLITHPIAIWLCNPSGRR